MPAILVVDDNEFILDAMQLLLETRGFGVLLCSTVNKVRGMIDTQAPDLIIMDINMPHTSGAELCMQLRREGYTIPIALFSAREDAAQLMLESGADAVMKKPLVIESILQTITQLLDK